MVVGHAQHGKDTVCEYLRDKYGISFQSSSLAAATHVIFPALRDKYGYNTLNECYEDRVNHRKEWFDLIAEYTKDEPTKLADAIYSCSDIYCGIRRREELLAIAKKYDLLIIMVKAYERKPLEPFSSFDINTAYIEGLKITPACNSQVVYINNNRSLEELHENLDYLIPTIKKHLSK